MKRLLKANSKAQLRLGGLRDDQRDLTTQFSMERITSSALPVKMKLFLLQKY